MKTKIEIKALAETPLVKNADGSLTGIAHLDHGVTITVHIPETVAAIEEFVQD